MYHHHQDRNDILASRASFPPDRHMFLQGANVTRDTGLVLSTDAKPRLKWTPELHERFIEAVNQLGGAETNLRSSFAEATPKTIMRLMGVPGLTLYHLKSHLQKYRLSRNLQAQASNRSNKNGSIIFAERVPDMSGTLTSSTEPFQTNSNLHISEALQMQIEVQRRLHEQLEVQRHLQQRIEAQGKYLQSVLEQAEETLGKQNLGSQGFEAAKIQLSELVSKVSNKCLNSSSLGLKEQPIMNSPQTKKHQIADSPMDSCLTSCEGPRKDQGIHDNSMRLRAYYDDSPSYRNQTRENKLHQIQPTWSDGLNETTMFSSSVAKDPERASFPSCGDSRQLSISIGVGDRGSGFIISEAMRRKEIENVYLERSNTRRTVFQQEREKHEQVGVTELDLNASDENDATSSIV